MAPTLDIACARVAAIWLSAAANLAASSSSSALRLASDSAGELVARRLGEALRLGARVGERLLVRGRGGVRLLLHRGGVVEIPGDARLALLDHRPDLGQAPSSP